jgi:hypothetical protein
VAQEWSLPEFCWSIWLAGLVYTWGCTLTASLQIVLRSRKDLAAYEKHFPVVKRLPPPIYVVCVMVIGTAAGLLAFRIYSYLFGFYGVFLSVFAEMEPVELFGRNGFINSDFFTPVMHLLERFWPMAAGVLIANWEDFLRTPPWKRMFAPARKEVLRLHGMILALPVFTLIAWAIFGESYAAATIILLMGLLFLLPGKASEVELKSRDL